MNIVYISVPFATLEHECSLTCCFFCPLPQNVDGGLINLDFPFGFGQYVKEIGLLDIDEEATVIVVTQTSTGFEEREIAVPVLGDNSYQVLEIDQDNVKWIKVMLTRSGAVTSVTFCPK